MYPVHCVGVAVLRVQVCVRRIDISESEDVIVLLNAVYLNGT